MMEYEREVKKEMRDAQERESQDGRQGEECRSR
jgi:hypothetical protein